MTTITEKHDAHPATQLTTQLATQNEIPPPPSRPRSIISRPRSTFPWQTTTGIRT